MQQLQVELKNVPVDAQLVHCTTTSVLNKVERLSVQKKVLVCNNSEVDHSQRKESSDSRVQDIVYVLNMRGLPLMPTRQQKANKLLKAGKARVVKRVPFTIQLQYTTGEAKQPITCGIDLGYENVGFSCTSEKKELINGTLKLDNKTKERLDERRMYRRNRRNRLWYRQPRFNNRTSTRKEGWLAPSIKRRLDTHISLVKQLAKILPITKVIVEVANFDIQKISNLSIFGKEYQEGSLYGYENAKSYLIAREGNKCQLCSKVFKSQPYHMHHIMPKSIGGTDKPDNLALLHISCHEKLHSQKLYSKLEKSRSYKAETFVSTIRWKIVEELKKVVSDVSITFGYITKVTRLNFGLEKSHSNDAFIIAGGSTQTRSPLISIVQRHKNSRVLQLNRKGFAPAIRRQRYSLQPLDLVKVASQLYRVVGIFNYGKYVRLKDGSNILNASVKRICWCYHFGTFVYGTSLT